MPELISNPLERLHNSIKEKKTVTEQDVDNVINETIKAIFDKYKDNSTERLRMISLVNQLKDKLKTELANLSEAYTSGRLNILDEIRNLWSSDKSLNTLKNRPAHFENARKGAESLTDPNRIHEKAIDDYEGWGPGWISESSNKDNQTRWTLSGYLTAMGMDGPEARTKAYDEAYDTYKHWTGDILRYKELRENMKMGKHLDDLQKYPLLEDEPLGYLAGCLALSENSYPQNNDAYRKYLFSTVDKLGAEQKFISPNTNKWEKGHAQMNELRSVLTPKEWNEIHAEQRVAFENLKIKNRVLKADLNFNLSIGFDLFLAKDSNEITNDNAEMIKACEREIVLKATNVLNERSTRLRAKVNEVETNINRAVNLNNNSNRINESDINNLKTNFGNAKTELSKTYMPTMDLDQTISANNSFKKANSLLNNSESDVNQMLSILETPDTTGGGGGDGSGDGSGPETTDGTDVYEDKWENAELVDGMWKVPNVKVSPNLASTPYRNSYGRSVGNISRSTDLKIVDVNAKCRNVEGVVFVQVEYNGEHVWVDESALVKGKGNPDTTKPDKKEKDNKKKEKEPEKKKSPTENTKSPTVIEKGVREMLGNVKPAYKYAEASNLILEYSKNPEKYSSGILINIPFNGVLEPATVYFASGNTGIAYIRFNSVPAKRYKYSSMQGLVKRLHQGHILSKRQYDILGEKSLYTQYEGFIGELDVLKTEASYADSAKKFTHRLEFDWPGRDPDIWVRPDVHGRIVYSIKGKHVGIDGGDVRKGYCENFTSLLTVLKRHRDLIEKRKKDPKSSDVEKLKEQNYDKIVHPKTFRGFYKQIGRVVKFTTQTNGVEMILNWGGGNDVNSNKNAKLKVWIDSNGQLAWNIYRPAGKSDGKKLSESGTSSNVAGIANAVYKHRINV